MRKSEHGEEGTEKISPYSHLYNYIEFRIKQTEMKWDLK